MSKTIGIVSGGQLGRMLAEAAIKLGFNVLVLDPMVNCPAAQVGAKQIVGSWKDVGLIEELIGQVDYFTIEIEHIDVDILEKYKDKLPINPAPNTIKLIQNKYNQKKFLQDKGFPVGEFAEITSSEQAKALFSKYGNRMVIKSKTDAYDGRGNAVVSSLAELEKSLVNLPNTELYAEKYIEFEKELAVMVAKDIRGNIACYPVTETIHERNICIETYTPAKINGTIKKNAEHVAKKTVSLFDGAGVFGIEMFLTKNDQILINEIAPRVHNSGHYTMDACITSQFEQHIRAITGTSLGSTKMKVPAAAMINILGNKNGPLNPNQPQTVQGTSLYMYGKSPVKVDRKMGHINAVGDTIEEATEKARKAKKLVLI